MNIFMTTTYAAALVCGTMLLCGFTQETQTELPAPPEPEAVAEEELTPVAAPEPTETSMPVNITIPASIQQNNHTDCVLEGISLDDISQGRAIVRIYPPNRVTIFDGISFIEKKPYIKLFPREVGKYYFIFVLQRKDDFVFIEREFVVE